jgi:flagellar biosynthesis component FlhA
MLNFEKRDILLISGLLLFMIGLIPFMAPIYAVLIVIALYFGIKFYVGHRKKSIQKEIGEGICIDCGSKISNQKCPNCDFVSE